MPIAKDMESLDERVRKFIEDFDGSLSELSTSIKDGDMSKVSQTLSKMQKNTDDLIAESEALQQDTQDSLSK